MAADPSTRPCWTKCPQRTAHPPAARPRRLAGMLKYGFDDARPVLERASARETAARVAAGTVARAFLRQALGVEVLSHVISIGASAPYDGTAAAARRPVQNRRQPGAGLRRGRRRAMIAEIEAAKKDGDTLGGVVEVVVHGLPVGLGSFTSSGDNRLDGGWPAR